MTLLGIASLALLLLPPLYLVYKPPDSLIRFAQRRWPDVLWKVSTAEKIVALTIDDGPSAYTDEILQILKANEATATFFIIGSHMAGHDETLQDLIRNGNELGNHAMYDEPSRSLPTGVLVDQIQAVEERIQEAYARAQVDPPGKYFRPGSGFFSEPMRHVVRRLGYRLVLGNVYPHDPQVPFWRVNASHILSMLHPGAIIICHDGRSWTAPMLRKVLPEIRRQGYRVASITELLKSTPA
jgi:peptidoglycan/xylan/chitin deacetylase (PgdA/CDA1 family)